MIIRIITFPAYVVFSRSLAHMNCHQSANWRGPNQSWAPGPNSKAVTELSRGSLGTSFAESFPENLFEMKRFTD